ncbi:MAG TPA: hypothetical protein VNQ78_16080 [Paracoccus sp. (in: a-proteobacteria)]|uniref:hypothetical protein n=1 Tax=Paracoccus sp. TaxID=267 RepID=UPI002CFEAAE4|nr:hypothetical protein [Paracoccus sp. (in: a-proteobacteria)]HWL58179.1 hypothetical protein [Paracoccus sp. (in: a-proteobacteria)]
MAIQSTEFAPTLRGRVDAILARIGRFMTSYVEHRSRRSQIEALEAKSDAELAKLGIKREGIAYHVFRDLTWI